MLTEEESMTSRHIAVLAMTILLAFTMVVQAPAQSGDTITVTDALGREVTLPENPERVTAAGRAVLMVADAVYLFPSARDRLTGVSRIDQGKGNFLRALDPDYGEKQILERNVGAEQVAATRPDVVIMKDFMKNSLGDAVSRLDIPVVYVRLETRADYRSDIRTLGRIFGAEERAEEIVRYYDERVRVVEERVADVPEAERPSSLFVYYSMRGGDTAVNVPPKGWLQTNLLETAGANPVWADAVTGGGWQTVNIEQLLNWDPESIFVVSYRSDIDRMMSRIEGDARWQSLRAVENDALYAFPVDFYSWDQPDARWVLGLQWLAQKLHPEQFRDFDMREAVYGFFDEMYGMSRSETREIVFSRMQGDFELEQ
jgi:iron complex transport system substrate-binding protein